jgi:hypothetical protein
MEEFAVALTSPGLTSKYFTNQQKFSAKLTVSLLKLTQVPDWLTSLFDNNLISGVVANLSARNVTSEIVNLFGELMARKFLSQDHIVVLHNLFQVCTTYGKCNCTIIQVAWQDCISIWFILRSFCSVFYLIRYCQDLGMQLVFSS